MKFNQKHFEQFKSQGYTILENALSEEKRLEISKGLRSCLPPWEDIKDNPPDNRSAFETFPFEDVALNRFYVEPGLLAFVKRILGSDQIHYKPGYSIVRYPGGCTGSQQGWHIDNGNNSLLPESEDWRYGQVVVWYWPEAVTKDQAPLNIIPKPYENDLSKVITLAVPANTLVIFHNYVWHSGSDYKSDQGQRYSHGSMYGLSEFHWEGLLHLTNRGTNPHFKKFIASLTAKDRELFRFPEVGHPYYTEKTLTLLEEQYPGWNARGEYSENNT